MDMGGQEPVPQSAPANAVGPRPAPGLS
jgi:hypothetical protein